MTKAASVRRSNQVASAAGRPLAPGGLVGVERRRQPARQRLRIDVVAAEADPLGDPLDMRRRRSGRRAGPRARAPASISAETEPLPLVPATCTARNALLRVAEPGREVARRLEPDPHAVARAGAPSRSARRAAPSPRQASGFGHRRDVGKRSGADPLRRRAGKGRSVTADWRATSKIVGVDGRSMSAGPRPRGRSSATATPVTR